MSIGAKPWEGGGTTASDLNDVTNNGATTANAITVGGVSIGTEYSLPTTDGSANQVLQTDGVGNVTFTTLDITGNLDYKGSYNATTSTPDLTTAEKGDFYIVSVAGSLAGVSLSVGDHIVFNQDASSPITASMFDKIDNTDAVASVNGQTGVVVLDAGDVGALAAGDNVSSLTNDANYVASGDNVSVLTNDANYVASGDNVSVLTNDAGYLTSAPVTSVNALTGVVVVSGNDIAADHTAANYTPANSNLDGHLSGIDTALGASASPTLDGVTTNGNTTSNDIEVGGVQVSGDITASANLTRTIGAEAERFITYYGDMNGAVRFKAKNDSGGAMTKGQVVYIKGVSGTIPTVDLADADNASAMPAFGLVYANANDQAEVQIVSFGNLEGVNTGSFSAGDTLYVSTTAGALTNSAPTGETAALQNIGRVVRSDASAGVIIVGGAGRSAATPNLDDGKIFLGDASNQAVSTAISSINLSSFNDDLSYQPLDAGLTSISGLTTAADQMIYTTASDTYAVADLTSAGRALLDDADASAQRTTLGLGTAATSDSSDFLASTAGLDDLSDVAYTPGAGIDGYVLTYDHSTTSWGAEAAAGGSVALDGIAAGTGDATLATAGNITIDATASDSDIIFRGTDGGVDTTFLTIDGSDGGTATFSHDIKMPTSGAQITMGPTDDVMITHVQNNGLLIELDVLGDGDFDPTVELKSAHTDQGGPRIRMNHSASDANNDIMGELSFEGKNATATQRIFGIMQGIKTKGANGLENGKILLSPMNGGTLSTADGLSIEGSDGDALVTVLQHDGSSQGLVLGSTLLTSTASELNILDVSAASPSAGDVLSYDGANLSWTAGNYQPLDAGLTSISGLTTAADKMIYTTASDTYAVADLTSAGRALLDDADASAQRTTLGLGTAATSDSGDFLASTAGLNDLSDVSFSAGAGIDGYVLTYDNATSSWGAEAAAGGSVALDGIAAGTGDATLSTAGNITIDATASDSDIIFRGTDGGVDTTFLTIDGSDGGTATFNHDIKMPTSGAQITMGPTNDVMITHVAENGLLIELDPLGDGNFDPTLELKSAHTDQGGPRIRMRHSASDANNDIMGELSFEGKNATATQRIFGIIQGIKTKGAHTLENGKILLSPMNGGTLSTADGLSIEGSDGDALVTVLQHDGSSQGLVLGTTLLTSTATELNILDVSAAAPSANDVLSYDGANLSWTALSYMTDLVDDTTPQLGGALDVNGQAITSATNGNVEITPNGTGVVELGGNTNSATLRFYDEAGTNYIALKAPADADISADTTFTLPVADGTSGQVLQTNGSAVLSWVDQGGGGGGTSYTYSAITADPANAQAWYHYSCTGSFTITLGTSGYSAGDEIRIKNMGTGTITLDPQTQTIDGSTDDYLMTVQYSSLTLVSTGSNWEII